LGSESKAQRAHRFAAEMGLQAPAQFGTVEGAVDAHGAVTGGDWKPYVAPADNTQSVDRQAGRPGWKPPASETKGGCVNEFWPTLLANFGPPSVADGDPISPFALAVSPPFAGQRFG
jgi:hypothetical protein